MPSAGATLAQKTMRQEDSYETSLPQSKFKATASLYVGLETVQRPVYRSIAVKKITTKKSDPSMCTLLCGFPKALQYVASED